MGTATITDNQVSLVVFTCEGREHLLHQTVKSFTLKCNFNFAKVILAIDGQVNQAVGALLEPDVIIQQYQRQGYVQMISKVIKLIGTPYFFWLEDDWRFHIPVPMEDLLHHLIKHQGWAQVVLSKYGPLESEMKLQPLGSALYQSTFGFSANPTLCNTGHIRDAFQLLSSAQKGDTLGEDGFENFLSKTFTEQNIICAILDPIDRTPISHEGYLETTPRSWHMTNSLEQRRSAHLLTIPAPSLMRRFAMAAKLIVTICVLAFRQFTNNKIYEYCFRIIATSKTVSKDE
jgi:hypothetical protein